MRAITPTSSRRPNTSVTPNTNPSILKIKLRELRRTSQVRAMIKAGQLMLVSAELIGLAIAVKIEPKAINGRAGIKEAISPKRTVRTTTGLPQIRCVIMRSNLPSFRVDF